MVACNPTFDQTRVCKVVFVTNWAFDSLLEMAPGEAAGGQAVPTATLWSPYLEEPARGGLSRRHLAFAATFSLRWPLGLGPRRSSGEAVPESRAERWGGRLGTVSRQRAGGRASASRRCDPVAVAGLRYRRRL